MDYEIMYKFIDTLHHLAKTDENCAEFYDRLCEFADTNPAQLMVEAEAVANVKAKNPNTSIPLIAQLQEKITPNGAVRHTHIPGDVVYLFDYEQDNVRPVEIVKINGQSALCRDAATKTGGMVLRLNRLHPTAEEAQFCTYVRNHKILHKLMAAIPDIAALTAFPLTHDVLTSWYAKTAYMRRVYELTGVNLAEQSAQTKGDAAP